MCHGTRRHIRMYLNAVADSIILYSQHDFYNIIFKIKHKLYRAWSAPFQGKILGAHLSRRIVSGRLLNTK
jgi:hypothetical protein